MIDLGNRMKEYYENATRIFLPRRTYTILRLDGKAFHTFSKGLNKPWDQDLIDIMNRVTRQLCKNIQGAKIGYTQSDEISILMTDFDKIETEAWFGGNIQKIVSVAASMATFYFAEGMRKLINGRDKHKFLRKNGDTKEAFFDTRVFTIPSQTEVVNYFIWRQKDAMRNSIQMLAQSLFSQKELQGKKTDTLIKMCKERGYDWEKVATDKIGRIFYLLITKTLSADTFDTEVYESKKWIFESDPPKFVENREFLNNLILKNN